MADNHWVCSNCGSISSRAISGGVVCAKCGANFPNIAENADITNQLTKLINTGKTEQIGNFRKILREELGNQLVNSDNILEQCKNLKELYPKDYLAGFYTAFFKEAVGNTKYKNYLKDVDCKIVCEPNVFLKEAMEFAIKHVDITTAEITNGFIEKICEQVNSHLTENDTELNCEYFKKQVDNKLEQQEAEMDLFADIDRDVFICYVSEDLEIAKEVYEYLTEGENISCFLSDYNLPKTWTINNADYWERIKSQIKQANVFLVISSNLLEHKINNGALKEIAFAKTQPHLARLEYKVDNSTEKLCEKRTQNLSRFFDGKTWIKREGKDDSLKTLAFAVSNALEELQPAVNTEQRNTKPESVKQENVVKAEAVATTQPTNSAKPTASAGSAEQESKSSTHLEIPYGTTEIGNEDYKDNFIITSVNIPASVTAIALEAFGSCWSLTSINVAEGNSNFKSIDGNLYSKDGTTLIRYPSDKPETSFTIPASVTYIDFGAVSYCKSLTRVTIPNSVTEIGCGAFEGCESLTSITIPASVTKIGCGAFESCESLTSVTIPNSVTAIGDNAFYECESLTSVTIPNSVTKIGESAFEKCVLLTNITIPASITTIGAGAFSECTALTSVTIPASVTEIDYHAFMGCESLISVSIPASVTYIGEDAFCYCSELTIYAEASSEPAGWDDDWNQDECPVVWGSSASSAQKQSASSAKQESDSSTNLEIPYGTTKIENEVYKGNKEITSVTIPTSVTEIGRSAFYDCTSLTNLTIPASVKTIGKWAFWNCASLTSITIPASVTEIGNRAFACCKALTNINVAEGNKNYKSIDGNLYSKDGTKLIQYVTGKTATSIAISNSVTTIGDCAFYDYMALTNVTIPASVTAISDFAFYKCSSLTSVIIPPRVTAIRDSAFSGCSSLTSVTIPESVTEIGSWAFYGCTSLIGVSISASVTHIGESAFSGCSNLTIYAEGEPAGWDSSWNPSNRPVVWGHKN